MAEGEGEEVLFGAVGGEAVGGIWGGMAGGNCVGFGVGTFSGKMRCLSATISMWY